MSFTILWFRLISNSLAYITFPQISNTHWCSPTSISLLWGYLGIRKCHKVYTNQQINKFRLLKLSCQLNLPSCYGLVLLYTQFWRLHKSSDQSETIKTRKSNLLFTNFQPEILLLFSFKVNTEHIPRRNKE
jgi:hypothetical protein